MIRHQFFGKEQRAPPRPVPVVPRSATDYADISHDHFDHLDMETVRTLAARGSRFVVPLGIGAHLEAWSIPPAQITELDWGESVRIGGLELVDGFKAIGAAHGPFDLTLIKIGACDWTWQDIHMSPEEAVRTHQDLGGRLLLPIHWGTFNLAFHAWNAPPEEAVAAAAARNVTIAVPRPGEFVEPSSPPALEAWWR